MVDDEFLKMVERLMRSNNAQVVLKFGTQTVIYEVIKRLNNLPKAEKILAKCPYRGIPFETSLIFGLPLQALNSFQYTVGWAQKQSPIKLLAFPL
ncbi:hypothetical protein BC829DRAFT_386514, partial [Chytridium lagenaria]